MNVRILARIRAWVNEEIEQPEINRPQQNFQLASIIFHDEIE